MDQLPSIAEIVRRVRDERSLDPMEVTEFCLDLIDRYESEIHAWVRVDADGARRQAKEIASQLKHGAAGGALTGVPIGVKDLVDIAGQPTEAGSPLRRGMIAEADAPVVRRLREQGAIILGKTVTTEFACFDPSITCNPWRTSHTPGGSSSGSAAAVSLQMCAAAIGSQTGGSIIRPASYCGVAGLKGAYDAIDLDGVFPVSFHLDHLGPIARRVADLAVMFQAMGGAALQDGPKVWELDLAWTPPQLRVLEDFVEQCDEPSRQQFHAVMQTLQDSGASVKRSRLPLPFDEVIRSHRCVMAVEAALVHRESFASHADQFGPNVGRLIREGLETSTFDYADALRFRREFQRRLREAFPGEVLLASPSTLTTAPATLHSTGDPRLNAPFSFSGTAALTIPSGLVDGLPCGLQLATCRQDEAFLLKAGQWCEDRLHFDAAPGLCRRTSAGTR